MPEQRPSLSKRRSPDVVSMVAVYVIVLPSLCALERGALGQALGINRPAILARCPRVKGVQAVEYSGNCNKLPGSLPVLNVEKEAASFP